jgi:tRNA(Ile)-lysidine synthase
MGTVLRPGCRCEWFDADKVGATVTLRHWQAGDRFQPLGLGTAKKLQDLFTDAKVPAPERRRRLIATTAAGEIFWVEGLRPGEKFKLDKSSQRRLKWHWFCGGKRGRLGCEAVMPMVV